MSVYQEPIIDMVYNIMQIEVWSIRYFIFVDKTLDYVQIPIGTSLEADLRGPYQVVAVEY